MSLHLMKDVVELDEKQGENKEAVTSVLRAEGRVREN